MRLGRGRPNCAQGQPTRAPGCDRVAADAPGDMLGSPDMPASIRRAALLGAARLGRASDQLSEVKVPRSLGIEPPVT